MQIITLEVAAAVGEPWQRGPTLTLVPSEDPIADAVRLSCKRTILVGLYQDVDAVIEQKGWNPYRLPMPPVKLMCGLDMTSNTTESRHELANMKALVDRPARSRPRQAIVLWPSGPRFRQRTSLCHLRETFWKLPGLPAAYVLLHHDLALMWYEPPHWPGEYR